MNVQEIRLAQFWNVRIGPLLRGTRATGWAESLHEVSGWLQQGVFCGYFDAVDVDVVWIKLKEVVGECPAVSPDRIPYLLQQRVKELFTASNPFREARQMPEGGQKAFELPLMSFALLLSDHMASDSLAGECREGLKRSDLQISESYGNASSDHLLAEVERILFADEAVQGIGQFPHIVAGYLHLLQHMEASRRFFEHAATRAKQYAADFESFEERVGGLNAWRVPLMSTEERDQFDKIGNVFDELLVIGARPHLSENDLQTLQQSLVVRREDLKDAWAQHHNSAFFERAR